MYDPIDEIRLILQGGDELQTGGGPIRELFDDEDWQTRSVMVKALTVNDDSGRHGVLVPREAYPLFPALEAGGGHNPSEPIATSWKRLGGWVLKSSAFRQYDRYPERRLTSLEPSLLNRRGDRIFAIATAPDRDEYRSVCLMPGEPGFGALLNLLGTYEFVPGTVAVLDLGATAPAVSNFERVLSRLRDVAATNWISTVRSGDTGVGATLEDALGISANSSTDPDLLGVELKASRRGKKRSGRVTLFAKTPMWGSKGRVKLLDEHGYFDENGRWSLYTTINGHIQSSSGWKLRVDRPSSKLFVDRHGEPVVYWEIDTLENSLLSKHGESVFVSAETAGKGKSEKFHYVEATHAAGPTIDRFLALIEDGRICHDFAIHRSESGKVRDHGFLFRITDGYQSSLFAYTRTYSLA